MLQTELLKCILTKAHDVKQEFGGAHLCASHIAVAVADFCQTPYTGFVLAECSYPRFEEERLRLLFSKEIKVAAYFRLRLSRNVKAGVTEEAFNVESCERMAAREPQVLSADMVFLCALKDLHESYKANVKSISSDESIQQRLQDTDQHIYDYVIDRIEKIRVQLQKRADEAKAIRDWRPAAKFAEPLEVLAGFFETVKTQSSHNVLTLTFPKFFGSANLKVSIHEVDGLYYIHDNGCAIKHLQRHTKDTGACERALKKVCHASWIHKGTITGSFTNTVCFFEYLKRLVFVAHADLYYTKATSQLGYREKEYSYTDAKEAQPFDETVLLRMLKDGIGCSYDENQGLYCWMDAKCSLSSNRLFFLIETLENDLVRLSDRRKGTQEGEVFEEFYWCNDDITPYRPFIHKLAARFGADFDGRDVYLTDKTENFYKALFKFWNLAVLLTEFGHRIGLP